MKSRNGKISNAKTLYKNTKRYQSMSCMKIYNNVSLDRFINDASYYISCNRCYALPMQYSKRNNNRYRLLRAYKNQFYQQGISSL